MNSTYTVLNMLQQFEIHILIDSLLIMHKTESRKIVIYEIILLMLAREDVCYGYTCAFYGNPFNYQFHQSKNASPGNQC